MRRSLVLALLVVLAARAGAQGRTALESAIAGAVSQEPYEWHQQLARRDGLGLVKAQPRETIAIALRQLGDQDPLNDHLALWLLEQVATPELAPAVEAPVVLAIAADGKRTPGSRLPAMEARFLALQVLAKAAAPGGIAAADRFLREGATPPYRKIQLLEVLADHPTPESTKLVTEILATPASDGYLAPTMRQTIQARVERFARLDALLAREKVAEAARAKVAFHLTRLALEADPKRSGDALKELVGRPTARRLAGKAAPLFAPHRAAVKRLRAAPI
jgi:hypothetical protein